jgi:hypothetical protein
MRFFVEHLYGIGLKGNAWILSQIAAESMAIMTHLSSFVPLLYQGYL